MSSLTIDGPAGRLEVPLRGFAAGVAGVVTAVAVDQALGQVLDRGSLALLLLGAVAAAAWVGGSLPGLATTVLAAMANSALMVRGGFALPPSPPMSAADLGLFLFAGALVSLGVEKVRREAPRATFPEVPAPAAPAEDQERAPAPPAGTVTFEHVGLTLSGHLDMAELARAVTEAGVAMSGAAFGAFIYGDGSGAATRYVTGAPPEALLDVRLAEDAAALGSPFRGSVSRIDDLAKDPRFGPDLPFGRMPGGQAPARSYLAAPVHSSAGVHRGGIVFGHPHPGAFRESHEQLIANLAAHASTAADNAHLFQEARDARAAAEAANHVKDAFLATLSHELRTPLTSIVGWANLLRMGRLPPEETVRAIETILRNATAQSQIIDELLDVSRIITGKLQLDMRVVEVGAIVKAAVEAVTPAANTKGIGVQFVQDPAGSWVMGDPDRLQQVFWNLLFNAIKFTPRHGQVRVSVHSVGSSVEAVVSDTGAGIEAEFLPRVFERFTQGDPSSTGAVPGLGLGLSIARQLAELHGGGISADSAGPGYGSTFTVVFPRSPVTAQPNADQAGARLDEPFSLDQGPELNGVRVLIVEDDDDTRELLEKVLSGQGAFVRSAAAARAALDVLEDERIDVLVSDIEMPGSDGYQLIRELRRRTPHLGGTVPAAALSAFARPEDRLRAFRAGFQLHLAKPVQPSELVTVVASLAARRS